MAQEINDLRHKNMVTPDGLVPYLMSAVEIGQLTHTSMDTVKAMWKREEFPPPAPFNENPDKKTHRWRTRDVAEWLKRNRRINESGRAIPEELK